MVTMGFYTEHSSNSSKSVNIELLSELEDQVLEKVTLYNIHRYWNSNQIFCFRIKFTQKACF